MGKTRIYRIILSVITIWLFCSCSSQEKTIGDIRINSALIEMANVQKIDYENLVADVIEKNDTNAMICLYSLCDTHVFDGQYAYDHGDVLIQLVGQKGEEFGIMSLKKLNAEKMSDVAGYLNVGLEYGKNKYSGSALKDVFPKMTNFIDSVTSYK